MNCILIHQAERHHNGIETLCLHIESRPLSHKRIAQCNAPDSASLPFPPPSAILHHTPNPTSGASSRGHYYPQCMVPAGNRAPAGRHSFNTRYGSTETLPAPPDTHREIYLWTSFAFMTTSRPSQFLWKGVSYRYVLITRLIKSIIPFHRKNNNT